MNKLNVLLLVGSILFGLANVQAQSQPATIRVRGAITGFNGQELQVKTRDGKDLKINVNENTRTSLLYLATMSDIKPGSFVGVTAVPRGPGGPLRALEVHVFTEAQRGTGEGHREWDLEPGSTMTNANIDAIVNTNDGKELTLSYKGGSQKIIVPPRAPIVAFKPADNSSLKTGAQIFCITEQAPDGSLIAQRISVGKDGLRPPM